MAQSKFPPRGTSTRKATARHGTAPAGVSESVPLPETFQKGNTAPFPASRTDIAPRKSKRDKIEAFSYLGVFETSPLERISLTRQRVPAAEVKRLLADLNIGQGVGLKALNLPSATVNKKAKTGDLLSREESERVIGLARLVGQLEAMVEESGDGTAFDARAWIARWLAEPLPAFGGARPLDLIDTMEGQGLVSSALAKLQSGAYA
jgi:putative toxin-antitoxin system antitoxin component (TIGR02293 family)